MTKPTKELYKIYQDTIWEFEDEMMAQLIDNKHKTHWEEETVHDLDHRMMDKAQQVYAALHDNTFPIGTTLKYLADLANYSMMIHHLLRKMEEK